MEENNIENMPGEAMSSPDVPETPSQSPEQNKVSPLRAVTAIFNGLGIGLLLGILLGLSISPVVSGVIATISSLLAVFIGLNEKYIDPLKSLRIGAFGLFAVAGIILGLWMRVTDPFKPTLLDKKNEYVSVGYTPEEAKQFITASILADTGKTRREAHVLYSSTVDAGACDILSFASESGPAGETMNTFIQAGGTWKELAETFRKDLPEQQSIRALIAMRDCFCGITTSGTLKVENNEDVSRLSSNDPLDKIEATLGASGESWQAIVSKIRERFPADDRKVVYLSTLKVLGHD